MSLATPVIGFGQTTWQAVDTDGTAWVCVNLDGWADLPQNDSTALARAFDHGGWASEGWYGPRLLELTGVLVAADRLRLQQALHRLRAEHAAALTTASVLTVDEVDGPKRLSVRTERDRFEVHYLNEIAARVVFALAAPWPIKAGTGRTGTVGGVEAGTGRTYPRPDRHGFRGYGASGSSGNLQAVNAGNAPVRPTFAIRGPVRNPRIIAPNLGRRLEFQITLTPGDELSVNTDLHSVVINGIGNRMNVLSAASAWFDLLPGDNPLQYRSDDNGGSLSVDWADGWW